MSREELNKIRSILWHKGYRQSTSYLTENNWNENSLGIHSNSIVVNPNVEEIKKLIGDKYHVSGDTNSETITIK